MLTEALGKSYPWAVGFFFTNPELSMELWSTIARISGFDALGYDMAPKNPPWARDELILTLDGVNTTDP